MSENIISNNRKIAKNTLFMYIRMFILMFITLFTSRVILQVLGVDDFGIYNVVYGMVLMFAFVSNAMATGTQRHLSYELGKEKGSVDQVFSACIHIHVILAIVIALIAGCLGSWFLNNHMNIPDNRIEEANIVFQISVFNLILSIIRVPYDAAIIAWEKFSYYAYISILEGLLRLTVAVMLYFVNVDKLIAFSAFQLLTVLIIVAILITYSHSKLKGLRLVRVTDKGRYKYLLSFSGWTLFGSAAVIGETQGLNLIVNIFYGVTINAAVGIANQVRGVVQQFSLGFQTALNPQLVKSQASEDRIRQFDLIIKSSKFSFYILMLVTLPLMADIEYILHLWLGVVPPYTAQITNLCIIVALVEALSSPLYTTIFAVGKIKVYQIVVTILRFLSILFAFLLSSFAIAPFYVYIVPCLVAFLLLAYRVIFIHNEISMDYRFYTANVMAPILKVLLIAGISILLYKRLVNPCSNILVLLTEVVSFFTYTGAVLYFCGLTLSERDFIKKTIVRRCFKHTN